MSDRFNELFGGEDLEGSFDIAEGAVSAAPSAPSKNRFVLADNNVSAWNQRQGREILDDAAERLAASKKTGEAVVDLAKLNLGEDEEATAADFFGSTFQYDPSLVDNCDDQTRQQYISNLLETPEMAALRVNTIHNVEWSKLAAVAMMREYHEYREKEDEKEEKKDKGDDEDGDEDGDQSGDKPGESLQDQIDRAVSTARAVKAAAKDVKEAKDIADAFGCGSDGAGERPMDPTKAAELYRRVRRNPRLQKILEMAGRFRLAAAAAQRQKSTHGADEVVGITVGGNLGRILNSERAKLLDDDEIISLEAMDRLLRRRCLERQLQGTQPIKAGPVMVLVDESGSMDAPIGQGMTRIDMAKALVMAIADLAMKQKRWVSLVAFSYKKATRMLTLPPGNWDRIALIDWLERFLNGGTYVPLDALDSLWQAAGAPTGKTDVICITDGDAEGCDGEAAKKYLEWKKEAQARLLTVGIGTDGGVLKALSDEVHVVQSMTANEEGVQKALSI